MLKDILNGDLKALEEAIRQDKSSNEKEKMREGLRYYKSEHDILDYKLMYYDGNGCLVEDTTSANTKIQHSFHAELVDQKVQYLLANDLCIDVKNDDENFKEYLKEYFDDKFQLILQHWIEGASNKGYEYMYAYQDTDKIKFQIADSLGIISIVDDMTRETIGVVRYYDVMEEDEGNNNKKIKVTKAEVWDSEKTTYYTQVKNTDKFEIDSKQIINPKPHILLEDDENYYDGGGLGYVPFFRLNNNRYHKTDLEPIKALIDDYDLMACSLSNNLQDFNDALYVVKGYPGDDLQELKQNIKTKKVLGVDEEGGVDVKTIDIPYDARKAKLELGEKNIYRFGMGFNSSQIGDGNITNVVIQSRYTLLNFKCNKIEKELMNVMSDVLNVIVADINKRYNKAYLPSDVKLELKRDELFNKTENATAEKTEEEAKQIQINYIMGLTIISDESKTRLVCDLLDLDYDEEVAKKTEEGLYADINAMSNQIIANQSAQQIDPQGAVTNE